MEIVIIGIIVLFIVTYRFSTGVGVYKFVRKQADNIYNKYAPYSYKEMRKKIKELGMDYTPRQYVIQVVVFAGFAAGIIGKTLRTLDPYDHNADKIKWEGNSSIGKYTT